MATTCFGPPPLPPNKRGKETLQKKNSFNQGNTSLTSSTYMSFKDPLDEILVLSSEDIPPPGEKSKKCHHHKRKNSLKKYKHALNLTLPKFGSEDKVSKKSSGDGDISFKSSALVNGIDRNYSHDQSAIEMTKALNAGTDLNKEYFLHSPDDTVDAIPLKTFNEALSKGCDDLRSVDGKSSFAIVRNSPFSRQNTVGRASFHTHSLTRNFRVFGNPKLSLARCSSEGDLSPWSDSEVPLSLSPLGSWRAPPSPTATTGPTARNKYFKILTGSWRNLWQLGGMSRGGKPAQQAKRVAPPAVPDAFGGPQQTGGPPGLTPMNVMTVVGPQHRLSGSSFGSSQGYASSEDAGYAGHAPDTPLPIIRDDHSDYGSTVSGASGGSGGSGKSPGVISSGPGGGPPTFTFPIPQQPLTHKAAVYYHHQLALQEDQGIDMTQSPGRDSPGSSSGSAGSGSGSRHSSASLDSGRASGCPAAARCSLSSCSLSSDHTRLDKLFCQGLPDHDIIHAWLSEFHFDEYAPLFAAAGYDLPTITRMTPEDLTAIGIKKPNHRKKLKAEMANLNVPENLPDFIPGSLEEWLRLLRLEEYGPVLASQGYTTVQDATQLAWEDLEDAGIVRLGHQKKFLLAIKRVKDIRAGKRTVGPHPGDAQRHHHHHHHHHPGQTHIRQPRGKSLESLEDASERSTHMTFSPESAQTYYCTHVNVNQPNLQTWRRSYDDGDITPTNEAAILGSYEGGGTLPRPRGLVKPRPVAKISATTKPVRENVIFQDVNEKSPKYTMDGFQNAYTDKIDYAMQPQHVTQMRMAYAVSPHMGKKMPPEPPKRQSSNPGIDQVTSQMDHVTLSGQPFAFANMGCYTNPYVQHGYGNTHQTTVEIHAEKHTDCSGKTSPGVRRGLPLSLPAYPSSDSLSSVSLEGAALSAGLDPPAPAPASPPRWSSSSSSHTPVNCTLAAQSRNGSDASFKSSSSTESDSLPFANENAGTIKQNRSQMGSRPHTADYGRGGLPLSSLPPRPPSTTPSNANNSPGNQNSSHDTSGSEAIPSKQKVNLSAEPGDVLNDIGNMLANLTDELDAMLEEEKRQGLADG